MERLFESAELRSAEGGFRGVRDHAVVELFYATGMRLSELQGLDTRAVDLIAEQARVLGKGRKERILPIGRAAAAALRRYELRRQEVAGRVPRDRAALFLSERDAAFRPPLRTSSYFHMPLTTPASHPLSALVRHHLRDAGADLLWSRLLATHLFPPDLHLTPPERLSGSPAGHFAPEPRPYREHCHS
jgi:site-specific recombinase XerD